ncbi:MAG: cell wall-binding repeat-containing protein, partial [Lachnospiraceae bacterium]|nr:cell wall-binding repeat-containing protein [Lachnospiraceae bacterium]
IAVVTGDATYTATFTEALRNYTVKFVHEDGTVLDTQTLTYGTMPEYKGPTPEKEATAQYTYTFSGWTPEITTVTGDATYTAVFTAEEVPAAEVLRVAGSNRYKTSLKIADELKEELGITKFDSVILATGEAFADALSGSYLSAVKTVPILLIREKDLSTLKTYITDNLSEGGTIYVLGGTGAIPEEWLEGLERYQRKRLSGSSRYTTNLEVLREAGIPDGSEILVATGEGFADSLSASSTGKPILLVKNTLSKVQKDFLSELAGKGMRYTILGGTGAVSDELKAEIEACTGAIVGRISGKTRYETTVMIAERYFPDARSVLLATAENYPDGLCAGVLGTVRKAPLILCTNEKTKTAVSFCAERDIHSGIVFGGTAVLSDETVRTILDLSEDVEVVVK